MSRSTKSGPEITEEPAIDPAHANLHRCSDTVRPREILCPDCRTQAVIGVIGQSDHLAFVIEGDDPAAWTKNLLAHHRTLVWQTRPQGRFNIEAACFSALNPGNPAAGDDISTFSDRSRIEAKDLFLVFRADQRAKIVWVADSPGLELDLRGVRVDAGLDQMEQYLNQAYMARLPWVRIIHGHGTGAMKSAVRDALRRHPLVGTTRAGESNEGGDGVTVVKLVSTN